MDKEELKAVGLYFEDIKSDEPVDLLKKQYSVWKNIEKKNIKQYFMLFNSIEPYLQYLNGGALKLYIVYCLKSKNTTGESWHSLNSLANILNVSEKTVNNWNTTLKNLGLIFRVNGEKSSSYTFLAPTRSYINSNYSSKFKKNDFSLNDCFDIVKNLIQNELFDKVNILHFFQWRKDTATSKYTQPYNSLCFALTKKAKDDKGNFINELNRYCFIWLEMNETNDNFICIDKETKDFNNDRGYFRFNSPLASDTAVGSKISKLSDGEGTIRGIAVTSKENLNNFSTETYTKHDLSMLQALNELTTTNYTKLPKANPLQVKKKDE
ncbi:MAG: helix-turn-helix domain-containing protein [Liquorilactobacillus ghanensis]|uniref:helix-turn-helix domain-containing protein n=1 Tax=Liquorilactobacillus ghanensis TaxID=399370 RepID=UPI0039E889FE